MPSSLLVVPLIVSLLAPTAGGAYRPVAPVPAVASTRRAAPRVPPTQEGLLFLTVSRAGAGLVADIPEASLGRDFQVTVSATERVTGGTLSKDQQLTARGPVLHWARHGDSLEVWEYRGWARREFQYARRGAYPLLPSARDALRVDARALFGLLGTALSLVDRLRYGGREDSLAWSVQSAAAQPAADEQDLPITVVRLTHRADGVRTYEVTSQWEFRTLPVVASPMTPRLRDPRLLYVGGAGEWSHVAGWQGQYVPRWRLDKRSPAAAVSDVVHPVVYRIDSAVPRKWVPWVTRGISAWLPVFEAIGFRHALAVRDAGAAEAPGGATAHPQDGPGCVVGWTPSAGGVTRVGAADGRTGELLRCTITIGPIILASLQRYAFLYLGGVDPGLRYPYPDSVTGRLLQMVVEHEVGHSLGLEHNFKAGAAYPADSLRSAGFVHRMGTSASVMAYTYFDAVAQPGDGIAPDDLLMHIGPYDAFALRWAYQPVPGAETPEAELPTLERWRAAQDTASYLRASIPGLAGGVDPSDRAFVVGNDVRSAEAVIRNLARTVPTIDAQRAPGMADSLSLTEKLRNDALSLWVMAVSSTAGLVGGGRPQSPYARPPERTRVVPVDSAEQVAAWRFTVAHVFRGEDPLVQALFHRAPTDTSILLFEAAPAGWSAGMWQHVQRAAAESLLAPALLRRVVRQAATTHVLPVLCAESTTLDQALEAAAAGAPSGGTERGQAAALRQLLRPLVDPAVGVCRHPPARPSGSPGAP